MPIDDKYFTELDNELRDLAILDWAAFVQLIGDDAITTAKVCKLKLKGKSLNQIASRVRLTKSQVETRCKRCSSYSGRNGKLIDDDVIE